MGLFNTVCCGGTFDHFHKGHKEFLKFALSLGKKVIIGITSDKYLNKSKIIHSTSSGQKSKIIESYKVRKKSVENFLEKEKALSRAEIVKIDDIFGPTLDKNLSLDAIIVTENSKAGAETINKQRQDKGLKPLKVFTADISKDESGKPISSSRIREGEINREGKLYMNPIWLTKKLFITDSLRRILEKPQGVLIKKIANFKFSDNVVIVTVGDVTAQVFNKSSLTKNISVIDFKVGRVKKFEDIKDLGFLGNEVLLKANNSCGCLTPELFKIVLCASTLLKNKKPILIQIEGEEDLTVLPLILALPLGSIIFYGQREQGVVIIEVSEEEKEKAYRLVSQFKITP